MHEACERLYRQGQLFFMDTDAVDARCDAELVRGRGRGTVSALGLLLARHRAPMRAVALGILGLVPEVDEAVQDACLTALRRIGDLRDPQAAGAWLGTIVRNQRRMQLRTQTPLPVGDLGH